MDEKLKGRGYLARNERKAGDRHPDDKGKITCCFCGQSGDLASWNQKSRNGNGEIQSLRMSPSRERPPVADKDEDIPF